MKLFTSLFLAELVVFGFSRILDRPVKVDEPIEEEQLSYLIEGDMMLSPEQMAMYEEAKREEITDDIDKKAVIKPTSREDLWEDGTVPYKIGSALNANIIKRGIGEWQKRVPCLNFVELKPRDKLPDHYIQFAKKDGCWAHLGRQKNRRRQYVSIGTGCLNGHTILHEIGHALGFIHTHTRPDRDQYVTINLENVVGNKKQNFDKWGSSAVNTYNLPYDYRSVMHYSTTAFSKDGEKTTIDTNIPQMKFAIDMTKTELSLGDVRLARLAYEC